MKARSLLGQVFDNTNYAVAMGMIALACYLIYKAEFLDQVGVSFSEQATGISPARGWQHVSSHVCYMCNT